MWGFFFRKSERDEVSQLRTEITANMQTMQHSIVQEIQQLPLSSEIAQLRTEYASRMQRIEQTLTRDIRALLQLPQQLDEVQKQIHTLESLLSPVQPSDDQAGIQDRIKSYIIAATTAINALEHAHTDWLKLQLETLQETQRSLVTTQGLLQTSIVQVSPGEGGNHGQETEESTPTA